MKYRIKTRPETFLGFTIHMSQSTRFFIQAKYKYVPFWITITRGFDTKNQAEEHIQLKQKEYSNA